MTHPRTDFWLHDIMGRRHARAAPERVVARSVRGRIYLRLASDWASAEDLAEAAWGEADHWPEQWTECIRVHLWALCRYHSADIEKRRQFRLAV